jgi:NAD(P)-dependent dehydrogenase (short-subunit alcohol dehydrogenase family)
MKSKPSPLLRRHFLKRKPLNHLIRRHYPKRKLLNHLIRKHLPKRKLLNHLIRKHLPKRKPLAQLIRRHLPKRKPLAQLIRRHLPKRKPLNHLIRKHLLKWIWYLRLMIHQNRIVLVTGASSGIGRATAIRLASEGARVVLASRDAAKLEELAAKLPGSIAVPTDMTDFEQIRHLIATTIKAFGRIDALVNNAGRAYEATVEATDLEALELVFRLNVLAPVVAMQEVIPHLRRNGGGSIVNISSGTSRMAIPGYAVYSSSKRALNGFSLTARVELAADNIKVSLVHPRLTATAFGENKVRTEKPNGLPGGRMGADYSKGDSPEVIAALVSQAILEGDAEYFAHEAMPRTA